MLEMQSLVHLRRIRMVAVAAFLCGYLSVIVAARAADAPAPTITPVPELRLPSTDFHYKRTKSYVEDQPVVEYQHASPAAIEAFEDIKYGVRIHWGIYSIWANGNESWPFLNMPFDKKQQYQDLYKTWNPDGFDAEAWMKLFKENGLEMFAFTAKHHEGFSMFDTKTRVKQRVNWTAPGGPVIEDCDLAYSMMDTPLHRDVVKELCDAGHKFGIKIDLYYSNPDWYDADFRPYGYHPVLTPEARQHPDLFGNALITERTKLFMTGPDLTSIQAQRMVDRHRQQLTELLTNYGKIDMLCLDNWFGESNWPQIRETTIALRKLQGDVMLRARGIGNYGDYYTPEGFVPGGKENTNMPWFVIYPLGSVFSYDDNAAHYKGGQWIIKNLVDAVAKGGRFMVGIGPDVNGRFHPRAIEQLQQAGAWLNVNGPAIYGTRARPADSWKEGDLVRFTRTKDNKSVYAIALAWPGSTFTLHSVRPIDGSKITMLGAEDPIPWNYSQEKGLEMTLPADAPYKAGMPLGFAYAFKIDTSPQ
jgi:alpha-L-fucosidase